MKTYLAIAYDCPDHEIINEIFEVDAVDLEHAYYKAMDYVPHAVSFHVCELDEVAE